MDPRLALDHITVMDATPVQLVEAAHASGCGGICLFIESMDVLPHMPSFNLYDDPVQRREFKARMADLGIALDLAYPFTLAGRTDVQTLKPALACAAELGAGMVNLLVYDRDEARRADNFLAFCELAQGFGLRVGVEFYPVSQIKSLHDALNLVALANSPGTVGINADVLHLMRSGGTVADLAAAPAGSILYGQIADGPATCEAATLDQEASAQRALAGEGVFDVAGFARALPLGCPISVEIPQDAAIQAGLSRLDRAQRAVDSVRCALGVA